MNDIKNKNKPMPKKIKWQLVASIITTVWVTLLLAAAIFIMVWSRTKAINGVIYGVASFMMGGSAGLLSLSISWICMVCKEIRSRK